MFFIGGIAQKQQFLDFNQVIECPNCKEYANLKIIMVYTYFSFFFIPLFKWGKRYFVQTTCCGSMCEIDKEMGSAIEKGTLTSIDTNTLHFYKNSVKTCTRCGYQTSENFAYCPKCGNIL